METIEKKVKYVSFWNNFDRHLYDPFFKDILSIDILNKYDTIYIYSVFGPGPVTKEQNALYIHFSGEGHHFKNDIYDLYYVADLPGKNVIPHMHYVVSQLEHSKYPRYENNYLRRVRVLEPKTKFCCFVTCNGVNGNVQIRNYFFHKLNGVKHVDSAGMLFNNTGFYAPRDPLEYRNFAKQYKFQLCFENTSQHYYLTEKLTNAYYNNTIPVYWGCPEVFEIFNKDAFLWLPENPTEADIDELIRKIIELDNDDELYKKMYYQPLQLDDRYNLDYVKNRIDEMFLTNDENPDSS
jgi:hypothetical protein